MGLFPGPGIVNGLLLFVKGNGIAHLADNTGKVIVPVFHLLQHAGPQLPVVQKGKAGGDILILALDRVGILHRTDFPGGEFLDILFQLPGQLCLLLVVQALLGPEFSGGAEVILGSRPGVRL